VDKNAAIFLRIFREYAGMSILDQCPGHKATPRFINAAPAPHPGNNAEAYSVITCCDN